MKKEIKLAISCSQFGSGGGMERYAYELAQAFYDDSLKPQILTRKVDAQFKNENHYFIKKFNLKWIPGKLRDRYFSWCLDKYRQKHNITTLIACSRIKHPDIAICGGTHIGFVKATQKALKPSDKAHIRLEKEQYHHAKVIIAHSKLMQQELIQLYQVDPAKIEVIYPPANESQFKKIEEPQRQLLRKTLGFENNRFYFIFPSGSHKRKGFYFLKAFFESTDLPFELVVIGKEKVSGKNIRHVSFTQQIEQFYQAGDAAILASSYEPFGLVGIESVACGTPIVFADNIGSCEVINEKAKCTFNLQDMNTLKYAIESVLKLDRQEISAQHCIEYDISLKVHVERLKEFVI